MPVGNLKKASDEEVLRCSFCSKDQNSVRKLIAGPNVFICDECVEVCNDIMADDGHWKTGKATGVQPPDPKRDQIAITSALTVAVRCALCRMPLFTSDALAVEARGPLCPGCVGAIQAALAERENPQ